MMMMITKRQGYFVYDDVMRNDVILLGNMRMGEV